jgi:hypothetical protein
VLRESLPSVKEKYHVAAVIEKNLDETCPDNQGQERICDCMFTSSAMLQAAKKGEVTQTP